MKQIPEAARSVDVILETDVLVVGSGPGGLRRRWPRRVRVPRPR
jgi:hypothetical protein